MKCSLAYSFYPIANSAVGYQIAECLSSGFAHFPSEQKIDMS